MSRPTTPPPRDIAIAVGVGAAVALLFAVILNAISTPSEFAPRLAAVDAQADRAAAALRPMRERSAYGAQALCTRPAADQMRILGEAVNGEATRAALSVDSLETRVEITPAAGARVTPVRLRFAVTGSYEGAVGLLARLSREQPGLFVDSLSLTPKVSNVSLSFSGRMFCAA